MPEQPQRFIDPKVLNKISRLELRARLIVEGYITGLHKSPYHGHSVEFASHREYAPGDEIKHLDWKVWARADRYYIKEFEEETNLACTIFLDCSKSMRYKADDGQGLTKFEYGCTVAASLAYLLQKQQDAVGLVTFDTGVRRHILPGTSSARLREILYELERTEPDNTTDASGVFDLLAEQLRRRGLIVIVSDLFVDLDALTGALRRFRHRRHEVVVFHVMHEQELTFPFSDNTLFRGLEISAEVLTEPRMLRKSYLEAVDRYRTRLRRICADNRIDYQFFSTKDGIDAALSGYLTFRQRTTRAARNR